MRILVVSQYYYPEPFRIHEICEELIKRGNQVTVLTGVPNYPDGNVYDGYTQKDMEEDIKGVHVIRCGSRPRNKGYLNLFLNYIDFYFKSNKRIKRIKNEFDIVYTYQLSPITSSQPASKFAKKYGLPSVMYCLDIWPESIVGQISEGNPIFKFTRSLSERIYKSFDKVIVTSPSFKNYLNKVCSVENAKLSYLPQHANDVYDIIPSESERENVLNFMFMGNIGVSQNVQCFIKACSLIKDRSKFKLHIVGSGASLDEVKDLAKELNVLDCVIFHGRKPKTEMPKYYAMADVCLVSLRDEGAVSYTIPGKVQEYMSAAKPILACIKGDTEFVINDAKCGAVAGVDDYKMLAKLMQQFINDPNKLSLMGANARKYYLEHFTLKNHVDELTNEFNRLVSK